MTEYSGHYIVKVGNVIHGVFPELPGSPLTPRSDLAPDHVPYQAQPVQTELNLTGGYSAQWRPEEDMWRVR